MKWASAGGGVTQAYVGYNTVGGSVENITALRAYGKKVTLANACLITSIEIHTSNGGVQVDSLPVGLVWEDSTSTIGVLRAVSGTFGSTDSWYAGGTYRWLSFPIGFWATAGDWWIGFQWGSDAGGTPTIHYDGSGSDRYYTPGGTWSQDGGTQTDSTRKYSIRANTIR